MMNSGIYAILNKDTGKRYIGSAVNIDKRWSDHKDDLRKNQHHSILLQRAWNKYSEDSFDFIVIETVIKENLISREQYYINEKSEYNICKTAGSCLGFKHSKGTRKKMSIAAVGNKNCLGRKLSKETRLKMSEAHTNISDEIRRKYSAVKIGENNSFYGKKHSEETRKKMRDARRRYLDGS